MSKRSKIFLLSSMLVIGALIGASFFFRTSQSPLIIAKTVRKQDLPVRETNYRLGKGNAVMLVEFADFQCPACALVARDLCQIARGFGDQVTLIFKHLPLPQHGNAIAAAKAAEAAGAQGRFWEMYDILYKEQTAWKDSPRPNTYFIEYADRLGLKIDQFKKDIASNKFQTTIEQDIADAKQLAIKVTPIVYVNGRPLRFPHYQRLRRAIEFELRNRDVVADSPNSL